jgi:hypothetical protein
MPHPLHPNAAAFLATTLGFAAFAHLPAPPAEQAPPVAPLAGPSAGPTTAPTSLVAFDLDGRLIRLDLHPAEAALRLVTLSPASRERTDRVLLERAKILDALLAENLDLLVELGSAGAAAKNGGQREKMEALSLLVKVAGRIAPKLNANGMLDARISAALDPAERRDWQRLVEEYNAAVAKDGVVEDGVVTRKGNRFECLVAESFRLVGKEVERSFQRQFGQGEKDFERALAAIGMTPEQEQKVRGLIADFLAKTKYKPTEAQKALLALQVLAWLNPEQQKIAIAQFRDGGDPPMAPKPASNPPTPSTEGEKPPHPSRTPPKESAKPPAKPQ